MALGMCLPQPRHDFFAVRMGRPGLAGPGHNQKNRGSDLQQSGQVAPMHILSDFFELLVFLLFRNCVAVKTALCLARCTVSMLEREEKG